MIFPASFVGEYVPVDLYQYLLALAFGVEYKDIFDLYPVQGMLCHWKLTMAAGNALPMLTLLSTDFLFVCSSRRIAMSTSARGVSTYLYNFLHTPSSDPFNRNTPYCNPPNVCHSAEVSFVFHSALFCPGFQLRNNKVTNRIYSNRGRKFVILGYAHKMDFLCSRKRPLDTF